MVRTSYHCHDEKASLVGVFPPRWILLLAVLLLGHGEARLARGAEEERPAKEQVEAGLSPVDQEAGAWHQGAPARASDARPRGLSDALYMHVGIDLPALDAATVNTMRLQHGPEWAGPYRTVQGSVGQPSPPDAPVAELPGTWSLTPDNEPIWRLTIRSAEAAAIAIEFEAFDADGEVWIYTHAGEAFDGPYSGRGPRGNGAFWSAPLSSDTVTVEYLPRQRGIGETKPPFRIPKISHFAQFGLRPRKAVESPLTPRRAANLPGSAERSAGIRFKDATCSLGWLRRGGHNQERLLDSVAYLQIYGTAGPSSCTAFLVNRLRESDGTELPSYYKAVFTNGHCINSQSQASQSVLYWKYRTSTCDGSRPSLGSLHATYGPRLWDWDYDSTRGGNVSNTGQDYALLLVEEDKLPDDVVGAGWTTADVVLGEEVYTLGHPSGQPLRLAVGEVVDADSGRSVLSSAQFWAKWEYGGTYKGASGSPVFSRFRQDGRVVGIHASGNPADIRYSGSKKFRDVRKDFRHLRHVESNTQRTSAWHNGNRLWFTFFRAGGYWVLQGTGLVQSGDIVGHPEFVDEGFIVELRNDRWSVRSATTDNSSVMSIQLGFSAEGRIDHDRDVDRFRLEVSEPTSVRIYTTGTTDTLGRLIDDDRPAWTSDQWDDDSGWNRNFMIDAIVSGVQFIRVSGFGTGRYTLHVQPRAPSQLQDVHGEISRIRDRVAQLVDLHADGGITGTDLADLLNRQWRLAEQQVQRIVRDSVVLERNLSAARAVQAFDNLVYVLSSEAVFAEGCVSGNERHFMERWSRPTCVNLYTHFDSPVDRWTNKVGMRFVRIPSGRFMMGSPSSEAGRYDHEGPQREVSITQDFWMGMHEVTQRQWDEVMQTDIQSCVACPVTGKSWEAVQNFISRLNRRESGGGYFYRLPTEAEWEYAARAGTTGPRYGPVDSIAWHRGNSPSGRSQRPQEVGEKLPNAWGLHDMLGNASEWTADWYSEYPAYPESNPRGPGSPDLDRYGALKVIRGGDVYSPASTSRAAARAGRAAICGWLLCSGVGFRLVRTSSPLDSDAGSSLVPDEKEFVWIPAGRFSMARGGTVTISRSFWMRKYEVTQGEWESVMGSNPSHFDRCGPLCPVEQVSWEDVQEFLRRLNERESGSGYVYRLPTWAEWDYALTSGTGEPTPHGGLYGVAWYRSNSSGRTHPVGRKWANRWGLHDMLGNVWEWTADWSTGRFPSGLGERPSGTDPVGPSSGTSRVMRGGGYTDDGTSHQFRSGSAGAQRPGTRRRDLGFRLVRTISTGGAPPPGGGNRPAAADDHGNTAEAATLVALGSSTGGSIETSGDQDWFRFEAGRATSVQVYTTGATDTLGEFGGQRNDDGGEGINFRIEATVSGVQYVRVSASGSSTGAYTLHVRKVSPDADGGWDWEEQLVRDVRREVENKLNQLRRVIDIDNDNAVDRRFARDQRQRLFDEIRSQLARVFTAAPYMLLLRGDGGWGLGRTPRSLGQTAEWSAHVDYPVFNSTVPDDEAVISDIEDMLSSLEYEDWLGEECGEGQWFEDLGCRTGSAGYTDATVVGVRDDQLLRDVRNEVENRLNQLRRVIQLGQGDASAGDRLFANDRRQRLFDEIRSQLTRVFTAAPSMLLPRASSPFRWPEWPAHVDYPLDEAGRANDEVVIQVLEDMLAGMAGRSAFVAACGSDGIFSQLGCRNGGAVPAAWSRTNAIAMEFVRVPAGSFVMGEPGRSDGEGPRREVTLSRDFWIGRYEVTQGQWEAVMGSNPSYFRNCGAWCPVETVTWEGIQEFLRRMNERESGSGYRYRLPTEAEWEYAARAWTIEETPEGSLQIFGERNSRVLDGQAWYGGNSGVSYEGGFDCSNWVEKQYKSESCGTHPVGMKRANGWGLHDMLGNVEEWTADWYGSYPSGSVTDPTGPSSGSNRVARGGSWHSHAGGVRSANRRSYPPGNLYINLGFRLVRTN